MDNSNCISVYKAFVGSYIPNWLAEREEISAGAKLCYARLCQYAGRDGICNPTVKTLAGGLGVKERQVYNYITELKEKKLLTTVKKNARIYYYFQKHIWMSSKINDPKSQYIAKDKPSYCSIVQNDLQHSAIAYKDKRETVRETTTTAKKAVDSEAISSSRKLISVYKQLIGVDINDKEWNRVMYPRVIKPVQTILKVFGGDTKKASIFLITFSKEYKKKNLSWTIETAMKECFKTKYRE